MMLHPADYFVLILELCKCVSHFKDDCFCELFSGNKKSRKLIAGVFLTESAVIDCPHYDVRSDTVCGLTVANH